MPFGAYLAYDVPIAEYETAKRYVSAVRNRVYRDILAVQQTAIAIDGRDILCGLLVHYSHKALKEKKAISQSRYTFKDDDVNAIALSCFWFQNEHPHLATFLLFVLSLIQFAGRCQEIARLLISNFVLESPTEWDAGEKIIVLKNLLRSKNTKVSRCISISPQE